MFEHLHAAQHHAFLQAKREGDIKHRQNLLTRATGWLPGDRNFPAEAFDHKAGSYLCFEEEKEGSPGKGQSITALKYVLRDRIEGDENRPEWAKTAFFASSPTGTARRSSRPGARRLYLQHREPIADQDIFERHSRKNHEYFIKMENIRDSTEIKKRWVYQ